MEILLFFLFCTKHFLVDFLLQTSYQYLNKGKYGHPGGIIHAGMHFLFTFSILAYISLHIELLSILAVYTISILEGIVHYHIDWAKVNINRINGWECNKDEKFWYMIGFDQYLHYLTYIVIVFWITTNCTL